MYNNINYYTVERLKKWKKNKPFTFIIYNTLSRILTFKRINEAKFIFDCIYTDIGTPIISSFGKRITSMNFNWHALFNGSQKSGLHSIKMINARNFRNYEKREKNTQK